jgi:hypothetical protein
MRRPREEEGTMCPRPRGRRVLQVGGIARRSAEHHEQGAITVRGRATRSERSGDSLTPVRLDNWGALVAAQLECAASKGRWSPMGSTEVCLSFP